MRRLTRREFIGNAATIAAGAALSPAGAFGQLGATMRKRPNLVFVFADEMRQQAMGFLGQDPVITPHLDRFAAEGRVLVNAVSNYPICSPYRAMLMTGKYPFANGVIENCTPTSYKHGVELREDDRCLPDVLRGAGYSCGYIGKWHLESAREPNIPSDGPQWWDCYIPKHRRHGFNFWHAYNCFDDHFNPHYWTTDAGLNDKLEVEQWSPRHETDVAIRYLRNDGGKYRDPDQPFALFVSHNPPHMPFHMVPERYVKRYKEKTAVDLLTRPNADPAVGGKHVKNYFAMVTGVDDQFGRILKCLEEEGLERNTIMVFASDHGEMMGSHGLMHKNNWYDESLLVPFIIRWPGRIRPGRDNLLVSVPDLMPTLLGLMGLDDRVPADVEGTDLSSHFLGRGGTRPRSALYYKIPVEHLHLGRRGLRTDRHTFVVTRRRGRAGKGTKTELLLYDNRRDPYQLENVAGKEPKLVRGLTKELNRWLKKTNDPWGKT